MVTTRRQSKLAESERSKQNSANRAAGDTSQTSRLRSTERPRYSASTPSFSNGDIDMYHKPLQVSGRRSEDQSEIRIRRSLSNENVSPPDWRKDKSNIFLLLMLYVLQGIPLGFAGSLPYILMARQVDYTAQALFSFAFYPFSVKLLWAPFVDSLFFRRMGRRKTWLIPIQYLIGAFMLYISFQVDELLGHDGAPAQIHLLVFLFTALNFLAATQDIVVDGWALSILSPQNVGYASTCNSVGQTAGYFVSFTVFLTFESKDFCNQYFYPLLGMAEQVCLPLC